MALAGRVQAATAYSRVKPLTEYTTSNTFRVDFEATASEGTVTRVDLWANKDGGAFSNVGTVYNAATPFYYTTAGQGDGRYSFYTIATLSTGDFETKTDSVEAYTVVDTSAPTTIDVSKLSINQQPSLVSGEVTGASGAAEANATVEMYADSGLTSLLRSTTVTAAGSFGPMTVGGADVRAVWLAVRDAAGNRGAAIQLDNNMSYAAALSDFVLKSDGGSAAVATFVAPSSAQTFKVQYRHAGGAVWSVDYFDIGTNGTTIRLTNLEAGRAYDVRIAPVDAQLNIGQWSMGSVRTVGTKVDSVVLPSERPVVVTTAVSTPTVSTATEAAAVTPAAETATTESTEVTNPVATPEATPESSVEVPVANETVAPAEVTNDNVATTDEDQNSSATPWVILAILIVLAGIATGGYFYWFSGPEEVTTAVTPADEKKNVEKADSSSDDEDKRW